MAFEEHRGDDVVAGVQICQELVQEIAMALPLPEMVVRVDDGQLGLEDRLGRRPCQCE